MGEIHKLLKKHGLEETRRLISPASKTEQSCIDYAHEVLSDELYEIGIAHAGFAMASLPHRKVNETVWKREGGNVKLLIESGLDENENPIGLPYGATARMILLYLQTQAVRTQSREIELGSSMSRWLDAMGIKAGGRTYQAVREQSYKISRCRLTFFTASEGAKMVSNGAFVRDSIIPDLSPDQNQGSLWKEVVRLDEAFFESLVKHPLPLREVAIKQISSRSKAIDIYIWLAYRLHSLTKEVQIPWGVLKKQFGAEYKHIRFFKRDFTDPLKLALSVYPEAQVSWYENDGLTLYPSAPPVSKNNRIR